MSQGNSSMGISGKGFKIEAVGFLGFFNSLSIFDGIKGHFWFYYLMVLGLGSGFYGIPQRKESLSEMPTPGVSS